ncbi:hypothetical protein G6F61_011611 [Rhizopus arrhizus]|nr:hypothetical protein G6F42_012039 [Rhizopus arrhizus]KAG1371795.1 hypothetical protein G6F61_011611 [Rhizopus arrhizus]
MNRQKARQRMNHQHTMTTPSANLSIPSIEESLQSWLTINKTPSTISYLPDTCPCCHQSQCENLDSIIFTIRKLEEEARLAAEIGQILLFKHEQHVVESNEIQKRYNEQLIQAQEKAENLERLLYQSDTLIDELEQERNKLAWEYQKTQKVLDKALTDIELCHQRSNQLVSELDSRTKEVEKLKVRQLMIHEADIREENLRLELEEVKQELMASKRAEHAVESKYKKLKLKLETIEKEDAMNNENDLIDKENDYETQAKKRNMAATKSAIVQNENNNDDPLIEMIKDFISSNQSSKDEDDMWTRLEKENNNVDDTWSKESSSDTVYDETPYYQLYHHVCILLEHLQQTDTRVLYQKLHPRALDLSDLINMSNFMIENILKTEVGDLSHAISMENNSEEFSLLIHIIQDMLKEMAHLRMNINDLVQVEYVTKLPKEELQWLSTIFQQKIMQRRHSMPIQKNKLIRNNRASSCYKRRLAVAYPNQTLRKKRSLIII